VPSVFTRVPAKVILMGEHYVVHGSRAISMAIDSFLYGRLDDDGEGLIRLEGGGVDEEIHFSVGSSPIARFYRELIKEMGVEKPPSINLEFEFPVSAGLGSSAAISAAIPSLLIKWLEMRDPTRDELYRYGERLERYIHGTPSGIDLTTVVEGGVILFSREGGLLDRVISLPDGIGILLIDSGFRRVTGELVARVSANLGMLPQSLNRRLVDAVDTLVGDAWKAILDGYSLELLELIKSNHYLLKYLGVYTPGINNIIGMLLDKGVEVSKVTGAGGGGCILVVGDEETLSKAVDVARDLGLDFLRPNIYPYTLY